MIIPRDCPLANDHPDQPDSSPSKPFYLLLQILGSMFNLNNVFLFIYGAILLSGHVRHRKLKNLKLFWLRQKNIHLHGRKINDLELFHAQNPSQGTFHYPWDKTTFLVRRRTFQSAQSEQPWSPREWFSGSQKWFKNWIHLEVDRKNRGGVLSRHTI